VATSLVVDDGPAKLCVMNALVNRVFLCAYRPHGHRCIAGSRLGPDACDNKAIVIEQVENSRSNFFIL